MARKVADMMWEMLAADGVKRCYGIVGDALNPVIDALRRNGKIGFVHVRHEEYGVFMTCVRVFASFATCFAISASPLPASAVAACSSFWRT